MGKLVALSLLVSMKTNAIDLPGIWMSLHTMVSGRGSRLIHSKTFDWCL